MLLTKVFTLKYYQIHSQNLAKNEEKKVVYLAIYPLFRKRRFALNENVQPTTSKFAMFM